MKAKAAWIGLLGVLLYWVSVHPIGFARGYSEDLCTPELSRQLMHEQIGERGAPAFVTDRFMAPTGMPVLFIGWSLERDWLGSYFWGWDRDFPFLWVYFGLSLVVTYLGVGAILRGMNIPATAAWTLAALSVVVHVPRHFKIWQHYELLLQHWLYWGIFLDAALWQRFFRERRWDWRNEAWRGLVLLGMLGTVGTFWGPQLLEWVVVRGCLLYVARNRRARGIGTAIFPLLPRNQVVKKLLPIGVLASILIALDVRWFLPLFVEVRKLGHVGQGIAWFSNLGFVAQPLWLYPLWGALREWIPALPRLAALDSRETVMTIGWMYWIPFGAAILVMRRKRQGPGVRGLLPFLVLIVTAILYACTKKPFLVQKLTQNVIPFMSYFRVASRWGLFLPQWALACVVLAWPELEASFQSIWRSRGRRRLVVGCGIFLISSLAEAAWLLTPVRMMPALPADVKGLLETVRERPGTTVLDLPFCVAGGNGICSVQECPNYPDSTTPQCLRQWHEKKVYGLYQGRMMPQDCELYDREPYLDWFRAWKEQRCFTAPEWEGFCGYLGKQRELSAVLLYPGIWTGSADPACLRQFEEHLGPPLEPSAKTALPLQFTPGGKPPFRTTQVIAFGTACLKLGTGR